MLASKAIQNVLDYVENHYGEELSVDILANQAHLSPYYFQRLFVKLVKKNVREYVQLRRLEKVAYFLKNTDRTIMEIALTCGFQSHSHCSRVFKETFSITPYVYRKEDISLNFFLKPDLMMNDVIVEENQPFIVEGMVLEVSHRTLQEDRIYAGKSICSPIDKIGEAGKNDLVHLWKELDLDDDQVGVDILTLDENPQYFQYFVGVENAAQIGDEQRIMPKGEYVVCRYEAIDFDTLVHVALYKASQYLFETWLPYHHFQPEQILFQKYFYPFEENCAIELWVKVLE